jgi:hypothetical protein
MAFIEEEFFHNTRRNMTVYEMFPVDFTVMESWWHLLNGSSTIKEGAWLFTKDSHSILLARSTDVIYWMKLFHDKRRNLIVYEKFLDDLIDTDSDAIY